MAIVQSFSNAVHPLRWFSVVWPRCGRHGLPKRRHGTPPPRPKASKTSMSSACGKPAPLSGPFAARFAVPRGPQNRGALSAKEHAGTGQTVSVFTRHASQVYFQCDSIDYQYWRAPSWWPHSSQQLAPRCTLPFGRLSLRRTSLSRLRPCLAGVEF